MSISRNVVILGKVGSGKRTLGNHIAGTSIFQCETALGTGDVGSHYGEHTREGIFYRILTVDTESLQTGYNNPVSYIQQRFRDIHSIIFAIPHGRYTDESHGSLMHAIENLNQQAKSISALVITHCEGMKDEQRKRIIDEFSRNARSSQVVDFMVFGILAVGFPDTSTLPSHLKPILQNGIEKDEEVMKNLLEMCTAPMPVENISATGAQRPYQRSSTPAAFKKQAMASKKSYSEAFHRTEQKDAETDDSKFGRSQGQISARKTGDSQPTIAGLAQVGPLPLAPKRVVLILGKVWSGKRTLGDRLAGQMIFRPESALSPMSGTDTMTRNANAFYAQFPERDPDYGILTIDTESLNAGYNNPIQYKMTELQAINLIIFTIPYGRYTDESHSSLLHVLKNLNPQAKQFSALVFTNGEGKSEQNRDDIIGEFKSNTSTAAIANFMNKGIYMVGFPDTARLPSQLKPILEDEIAKDAEMIKTLVGKCNTSLPVTDLTDGVQRDFSRSSNTPHVYVEKFKCILS